MRCPFVGSSVPLSGNPNLFGDGDFCLTDHRLFSLSALIKGPSGVVSEDTTRHLLFFVLVL